MNKLCPVFLSNAFYIQYPHEKFPEIEQKRNRPYLQFIISINNNKFAIPFRSNINHENVFWTDKANKCGLDFSKSVYISSEKFIDYSHPAKLRQNEHNALKGKDYIIETKMINYIKNYKKAKRDLSKQKNKYLVKFSTLQYFENYI
jgi:protein AbiQ